MAIETADSSSGGRTVGVGELLRPVRGRVVAACVVQALGAVAGLIPFVAVAELARDLLSGDTSRAWAIAGVAVVAVAVRFVLVVLAGTLAHLADADFQLGVRRSLAEHLGRLPLGWFGDRGSGRVRSVVTDDVTTMHNLVAHGLLDTVTAVITPLAAIVYLVVADWRMALVTLVPVVVGVLLYRRSLAGYAEGMAAFGAAMGAISTGAVEFVQGVAVVKTFGSPGRAHARFTAAADDFADFFLAWVRRVTRLSAAAELALSPVAVLVAVLVGGTALVTTGALAPLDVLPFALLGMAITAPIQALSENAQAVQAARRAAADVGALLGTPPLPRVAPDAEPPAPGPGRVELRGVAFSYDGEREVLTDIDLCLEPGTLTALVGPSGSGKSTLASLIPRFHDVTAGSVSLDGIDVRRLPERDLYSAVGFVFQDVTLIRTSIAENIALGTSGTPDAQRERIERAARAAAVHDRIMELPRGYDTVVGDDVTLSGGEAQRISIARAVLAGPRVLVLDEATAFADPESEADIQRALSRLAAGRTVLVVAHRLHTVLEADRIVVLDGGRIVESGPHDELLARGGRYAAMWAAQNHAQHHANRPTLAADASTDR